MLTYTKRNTRVTLEHDVQIQDDGLLGSIVRQYQEPYNEEDCIAKNSGTREDMIRVFKNVVYYLNS